MNKRICFSVAILAVPSAVLANEGSVAAAAVIGAAGGLVLGLAVVVQVFIWTPIKKKIDAEKSKKSVIKNELTPLMVAAADGNDHELSHLIAEGADVNTKGKSGETALMMAAKNDKRTTVRLLIKNGADIHAKTLKGNTAREIARQHNKLEVADIIGESLDS